MDDYARTLYMIALREIQDSGEFAPFVCDELKRTLRADGYHFPTTASVDDLFHHFASLFDGKCWTEKTGKYTCDSRSGWWEDGWIEPRVRALECLLRD